jgi:hypothetical protein
MPDWAQALIAGLVGLGLIGGVFWFAFRRPPERRRDGPEVSYDASQDIGGGGPGD